MRILRFYGLPDNIIRTDSSLYLYFGAGWLEPFLPPSILAVSSLGYDSNKASCVLAAIHMNQSVCTMQHKAQQSRMPHTWRCGNECGFHESNKPIFCRLSSETDDKERRL